jgi:hypothetical protein
MATTGLPPRDALQRLLDGLQALIREHLALAHFEAKEDLRSMGRDVAISAAGVPALMVGYILFMAALALLLGELLPLWAAFGIVALVNLGAGAALTMAGAKRVSRNKVDLQRTGEELKKDKAWLASLKDGTAPQRAELVAQGGPVQAPQH